MIFRIFCAGTVDSVTAKEQEERHAEFAEPSDQKCQPGTANFDPAEIRNFFCNTLRKEKKMMPFFRLLD